MGLSLTHYLSSFYLFLALKTLFPYPIKGDHMKAYFVPKGSHESNLFAPNHTLTSKMTGCLFD